MKSIIKTKTKTKTKTKILEKVFKKSFSVFPSIFLYTIILLGLFFSITPNKTEAEFLSLPNTSYSTDGSVNASIPDGSGGVYIGGSFTKVGTYLGYAMPVDINTGLPSSTFPIVNGQVSTSIPDGSGGWYIGGNFTTVGGLTRNRLAHINSDNTVDTNWNPNVTSGTVNSLAISGSTIYAGGNFSSVNGGISRNRLAAFNLTDGTVTSWNPNVNSTVSSLAISGTTIYAGGSFTTVNTSITRNHLAAFNLTDGTVTSWDPNANAQVNSLTISGTTIYAGGNFTKVNGAVIIRNRLAAFNLTDGTVTSWDPNANAQVNSLTISGTTIYAGGTFTALLSPTTSGIPVSTTTGSPTTYSYPIIDGDVSTSIPDGSGGWYIGGNFTTVGGLTRNRLAHINSDNTVDTNWNPDITTTNSYIYSLAISGTTIYAGGYFTSVNGGATPRNALAAFNLTDGTVDATWNPNIDDGSGSAGFLISTISIKDSTLYAGGQFTSVNGGTSSRYYLAAFNLTDGTVTSWDPGSDGQVNSLAISGTTIYAGGSFTTVNISTTSTPRTNLAAFNLTDGTVTSWDPGSDGQVYSLAISGTTIYAGGLFLSVNGGTSSRTDLAAFNLTDGTVTSWDANVIDSYNPVLSLVISGTTIYVGGVFTTVNGSITRNSLAAFNLTDGTVTSWDPNGAIPNNYVHSLAISGTTIYVGGSNFIVSTPRNNLAAFNLTDGTVTSWNPNATNGNVNSLAISGTTIYAGGTFTKVNGVTITRNNLAAFNLTDGTVTSWDPNATNTNTSCSISSLSISGSNVYLGENCILIGNYISRNNLAHINSDNTVDTNWNPNVTGYSVYSLAISGTTIYAGGNFTSVNGGTSPRNNLAAFNLTDGTVTSWDPNANGNIYSLAISGTTIYAGGQFTKVNGAVITRNNLAAFNLTDGTVTSWNTNVNSSGQVNSLTISGTTIYAGGSFTTVNTSIARSRLAAFNLTDGTVTSWNPNANGTVNSLAISGTTIYVGGQFTKVNGVVITRNRLAAFNLTDGTVTSWNPNANGTVNSLAISGTTIYAGGSFTSVNTSITRNRLAAFNLTDGTVDPTWAPDSNGGVNTLTISNTTLYVGGYFSIIGVSLHQGYGSFDTNLPPNTPTTLAPTNKTNGSTSSTTQPALSFTLSDPNNVDTAGYQILIDTSPTFTTPVVDYTSSQGSQGVNTFTVGQAVGSGSYTVGIENQTLSDASYYWKVKSIDSQSLTSSYAIANNGTIAFIVDSTAAPVITNVSGTKTTNTATITWDTSKLSSSIVSYGTTASYGNTTTESDTSPRVIVHTVIISPLTTCTTYHYKVTSQDEASNITNGTDNTLITLGCITSGSHYQLPNIARYTNPTLVITPTPTPTPEVVLITTPSTSTVTTTTTTTITLTKLITAKSTKAEIKKLQTVLNTLLKSNLKVDGIFGKQTLAAIKKFQKDHGLKVDGVVGPKTRGEMNKGR